MSSKRQRRLVDADGVLVDCKGFTCRRCGEIFNEMDTFLRCGAPRIKEPKKPQVVQTVEQHFKVDLDELKQKLLELRAKREESK